MMGTTLGPHPERVSEAYADERIREKIEALESQRPREGLRRVDEDLKRRGVSAATRLHLITAVVHLGRLGEASRLTRSAGPPP